jgi:hypothetical protein
MRAAVAALELLEARADLVSAVMAVLLIHLEPVLQPILAAVVAVVLPIHQRLDLVALVSLSLKSQTLLRLCSPAA